MTATSKDGQTATATIRYTVKPPTPRLRGLELAPRAFHSATRGPTIGGDSDSGTLIRYQDTLAARTIFGVLRCIGPHGRCTKLRLVSSFSHRDHRGANRLRFTGRLHGHALRAGRYVLRVIATLAGQRSRRMRASFVILAHHPKRKSSRKGQRPRLPTELAGARALEVRPAVIGTTGDGTGYLGGFTGTHFVSMPERVRLGWAGRLRWTSWSTREAKATGASWVNNGTPNDAEGTFYPCAATVRAYDPVNGIFRRLTRTTVRCTMTVQGVRHTFPRETVTLRVAHYKGFWHW